MRHTVEHIQLKDGKATGVVIRNQKTGEVWTEPADHVVANVTVQNMVQLLGKMLPRATSRWKKLEHASGAFVVYLGVTKAIPPGVHPISSFSTMPMAQLGRTIPCLSQSAIREMVVLGNNYASSFVDHLRGGNVKIMML